MFDKATYLSLVFQFILSVRFELKPSYIANIISIGSATTKT